MYVAFAFVLGIIFGLLYVFNGSSSSPKLNTNSTTPEKSAVEVTQPNPTSSVQSGTPANNEVTPKKASPSQITDKSGVGLYLTFPLRWSWKATAIAPVWRQDGGPFIPFFQEWGSQRTLAGNGEQQVYVDPSGWKNAGLNVITYDAASKSLVIHPRLATPEERALTGGEVLSGMLSLEQLPQACPKTGVWRIVVKMPGQGRGGKAFQGAWPALWLMMHKYPHGTYGPPQGDPFFEKHIELDIYEGHGREPKTLYVTDPKQAPFDKAPEAPQHKVVKSDTDPSDGFHEWVSIVTPTSWKVYLDGVLISSRSETNIAKSYEKYLIVNLAVGGKWFGNINSESELSSWEMALKSIDVYDLPADFQDLADK